MKELLIITRDQFGILTDTYQYCKYLYRDFNITYVCFDEGFPLLYFPEIKVHYISHKGPRFFKGLRFMLFSVWYVLRCKGFCFIVYFSQCEWIKRIIFWKKMHLDIRTLSVKAEQKERIKQNRAIRSACRYFDSISVITKEIGGKLGLPEARVTILPLGADKISSIVQRNFLQLRLLYVGTLSNRNIIETVIGIHLFMKRHSNIDISYDIIGDGEGIVCISDYIKKHRLESQIRMHGRLSYDKLKPYFDYCNIGVSYIPICDYYQNQPPTKTYEYIASGLFCIATNTFENKKVITQRNGILIEDNSQALYNALEMIWEKRKDINPTDIVNTSLQYSWKYVIQNSLLPVLYKTNAQ